MPESDTYKIVEVAGTSPDGVTEAMRAGVKRAARNLRQIDWVEVVRDSHGEVKSKVRMKAAIRAHVIEAAMA